MADQLMDTQQQLVFANSKVATNMPFFDGTTLVFGQSAAPIKTAIKTTGGIWKRIRQNKVLAERLKKLPREQPVTYRAWKLAYCNWNDKTVQPIVTGLPAKVAERSPAFYREGNQIHLSFIGGVPTSGGFHYRLYTCSGPDLGHLEPPKLLAKPPLFFGFVSPHHICWGIGKTIQLSEKATGKTFSLATTFYRIASVTFLADAPAKLLITGLINKKFECQTVLYDLATGTTSDVSAGGPVYKASLYGNQLVFTQRSDDEFENRQLFHSESTFSPSTIQISKGK